ncbi:putative transporter [Colletotrichum spinosum]|uniref:Putative transporter n=1 Tax=Colletotrichum spinosum TaxID=1347390 RepID=A0A4R8QHS0_9PEZI|nr:putative transporter [Colletotrichum spinosum]
MAAIIPAKTAIDSASASSESVNKSVPKATTTAVGNEPLGKPRPERRFWFQKRQNYDPQAVGTQPSVYDDPALAPQYQPRQDWENLHRFNPSARWTWKEEDALVRKTDRRIMIWACIMFVGLEIDRANLSQALTDNFLDDLGMTTNDYNMGNTVFSLSFLCAELPSQLVSKWVGPDRWIPAQLVFWSLVAICQFKLNGYTSFIICRCLLGLLQGGFIPDIILYLSYFYKHAEMTIRLGFFWMAMTFADILCAILAYGILHMRGVLGHEGWRWLFLLEGLLTMFIGFLSFFLMPAGPTQTAGWFRGKNGWYTPREEEIMVNRIIRDDPNKGSMHNRQRITLKLLWQSVPIYLIGLTFLVPATTPKQYLTLSLRGLGFDTFQTNLLVIPQQVLGTVSMMLLLWIAERTKNILAWAAFSQVWMLPFLVWLRVVDTSKASSIIGSNIYRKDDAPLYCRGNSILLGIVAWNLLLYAGSRGYYIWRNKVRGNKWEALRAEEKVAYLDQNDDQGSKRLDFRFTY